jgi:uncharacterized protein (TIGR02246 family)
MKWFAASLLLMLLPWTYAQEKMQAPAKEKATTHSAPASLKTSVQKLADDWKAAFQAKDADKVAEMYSDDAVLITVEGTFRGRNEIKTQLKKMIDRGDTVDNITTTKAVHFAQIAYAEGTFSGTGPDKSGQQAPGGGSWVVSLKNDNGKWMLITHTSVPSAAAAMAKPAAKSE